MTPVSEKAPATKVEKLNKFEKFKLEKDGLDEIHAALKVGGFLVAGWRSYRLVPGAETGFYEKLEAMKADGKFDKEEVRH